MVDIMYFDIEMRNNFCIYIKVLWKLFAERT